MLPLFPVERFPRHWSECKTQKTSVLDAMYFTDAISSPDRGPEATCRTDLPVTLSTRTDLARLRSATLHSACSGGPSSFKVGFGSDWEVRVDPNSGSETAPSFNVVCAFAG
jgi:hypothetical protein